MRPICKCGERPKAVNYKKDGKIYYRSKCEVCLKNGLYHGVPRWKRAGYQIKNKCERCGFSSDIEKIFRVFHVDGNLNNCRYSNLKTLCSNCSISIQQTETRWKIGDLEADY